MSRSIKFLIFLAFALVFATAGLQPAKAAPLNVDFGAQTSNGCLSGDARFNINFDVPDTSATYTVRTIATAAGKIYMDELFSSTGAFFESATSWGIFNNNSGGTRNALMPIPAGTPVVVTINFSGATDTVTYECAAGIPGRGIPDGFVLRTIICTVAVFDAPNGNPESRATPSSRSGRKSLSLARPMGISRPLASVAHQSVLTANHLH
jgi:hypothetical protein